MMMYKCNRANIRSYSTTVLDPERGVERLGRRRRVNDVGGDFKNPC